MNDSVQEPHQHGLDVEVHFGTRLNEVTVNEDLERLLEAELGPVELDVLFVGLRPFDPHGLLDWTYKWNSLLLKDLSGPGTCLISSCNSTLSYWNLKKESLIKSFIFRAG